MERDYRKFTGPAELHKAINTLHGIMLGITCDAVINDKERDELVNWCSLHAHLKSKHPFSEIIPLVQQIYEQGDASADTYQDLAWVCSNFTTNSNRYDQITSAIQLLEGMIHGIMSDGALSDDEIHILRSWVDEFDFLNGTYPYDEIYSLLISVLEDGKVDDDERNTLMAFFSNVIEFKNSYNLVEQDFSQLRKQYSVAGVCAFCPDITIADKNFCFTGESYHGTRKELAAAIESLGGVFKTGVSTKTDYLVVGNAGNACWAYACYGRKIEEAMALRKEGAKVVIVNETDFWDAVEDAKAGIE